MISKKKRVNKRVFQTILGEGKTFSTPFFLFRFIKSDTPHFAFVVPKSLVKRSNKRNSLRRRGYNIIRSMITPTLSGIFFFKKEAILAEKDDLKKDIELILKKTNFK